MDADKTVGVVVGIFGDHDRWMDMAAERAIPSIENQTYRVDKYVVSYCPTLHEARNKGADMVGTDYLIFLDADDELDPQYVEKMMVAASELGDKPFLIQPSTLGVVDGREDPEPVLIPRKPNLLHGNWMVIGTMLRAEDFFFAGGFLDMPLYEDWELYIRMWLNGAYITAQPEAIYRVHVNPVGRNSGNPVVAGKVFRETVDRYRPVAIQRGLI